MARFSATAPIVISLILYAFSLFLPALRFESHPPVKGITALMWGWWGLLSYDFPWLANLAYFVAVIQFSSGKRVGVLKFVLAAIGLGLLSLLVKHWYFSEAEATPVKSLGSGFYCWMSSFMVLLSLSFMPMAKA